MSFVLLPHQPPVAIALCGGALWLTACGLWLGVPGQDALRAVVLLAAGALWPSLLALGAGGETFAVLLCIIACGATVALLRRDRHAGGSRLAPAFLMLGLVLALGFLTAGRTVRVRSLQERWRTFSRYTLLDSRETRYQHVDVGARHGQRVFVLNGISGEVFPDPYRERQDLALLLTQHPAPERILIIGGGLGGLCQRILQAGPFKVDYVEMDPALVYLYRRWLPPTSVAALRTERFAAFACDGRYFVRRLRHRAQSLEAHAVGFGTAPLRRHPVCPYELVLINLGDPTSASASRFYTVEFFREVRQVVAPGGVVAVWGITGAENYLRGPVLRYAACIYRTLRAVFPQVVVRPGEELRLFAAAGPGPTSDPVRLAARFDRLGLKPPEMRFMFADQQFPAGRVRDARRELSRAAASAPLNTDDRPLAYALFLAVQEHYAGDGRHVAGGAPAAEPRGFFGSLPGLRPWWFVAPFAGCLGLLGAACVLLGRSRLRAWSGGFALVTTGMFGLATEVLIIYAYQVRFGYVYRDISLIVGLFMLGLVAGAGATGRVRGPRPGRLLLALECLQVVLLVALPALVRVAGGFPAMLVLVAPLAGLLTGAEFPAASRLALQCGLDPGATASLYDAADHAGAIIGASAVGLVLMPAFGLASSASLLACAKAASLVAVGIYAAGRARP